MRLDSYRDAARHAVGLSIAPYGYTLTVWTSGAVLTHARGVPSAVNVLFFMLGAVAGFALVALTSFGRLGARVRLEAQQPALWAGLHVLPIGAAIGATALIADLVKDRGAWPLGGFGATVSYLMLLALQFMLAI